MFAIFAVLLFAVPTLDAASAIWRDDAGCTPLVVVDGDTVKGFCEGSLRFDSIRLMGFDTPEFRGECLTERLRAMQAPMTLRWHLWTAREATFVRRGRDRHDRVLAVVTLNGDPLHTAMIRSGIARPYGGGRREGWCA